MEGRGVMEGGGGHGGHGGGAWTVVPMPLGNMLLYYIPMLLYYRPILLYNVVMCR